MKCLCGDCGVLFKSSVLDLRRIDGGPFYCPNGHRQSFAAVIQREREAEAAEAKRIADEVAHLQALYVLQPTFAQRALQVFRRKERVG